MTISRRELLILPAALRDIFYTGKLAQKNTDTAHNAISVYFYNLCLNLYPFRQASKIHTLLPGSASENGSSANLSGHFTWIFAQRSPPSSPHSDGYLHEHGCRKDIRSYGRSSSGFWNRRPDTHPSPAPRDHNHHSMREKGSRPHNTPDPWLYGSMYGWLLYCSRSDNVHTGSYRHCKAPRNDPPDPVSRSGLHPRLHGSGNCCSHMVCQKHPQ